MKSPISMKNLNKNHKILTNLISSIAKRQAKFFFSLSIKQKADNFIDFIIKA